MARGKGIGMRKELKGMLLKCNVRYLAKAWALKWKPLWDVNVGTNNTVRCSVERQLRFQNEERLKRQKE